jgi:hypothetical protein
MMFEIAYISYNPDAFKKYLGPSLESLSPGNFIITAVPNGNKPASAFNKVLKESKCEYIIFTHEDISFSSNLLERVEYTIKAIPDFGVLGLVGRDKKWNYCWSIRKRSFVVSTLDCCFVVIRKSDKLMFDEKTFDDYHLYIEDYCMQVKKEYGRVSCTLLMNSVHDKEFPDYLRHHFMTTKRLGFCWGKYKQYRDILFKRYPDITTT